MTSLKPAGSIATDGFGTGSARGLSTGGSGSGRKSILMTDLKSRIAEVLRRHEWWLAGNLGVPGMVDATTYKCLCGWNGDDPRGHQAAAIIAELALDEKEENLPVFVEDVPRRLVENRIFADGEEHYARHIEWIPHSHYRSPWYGDDCPDCQDEFGVHDRRRAEIIADSLRTAADDQVVAPE